MKKQVLLLLIFLLLASVSQATNLDIKAINGTEFTLLSNTDQCLVDCEAWIQWDLTQGIATDVQLPIEKTSQFNIELVKEKQTTKELQDFGVEVWEEIPTEVIDYIYVPYQYNVAKKDLDEKQTCETIGCVEKDVLNCECTTTERIADGHHTEYNWEKVSNDFYGFKALKGKVYRLRVWGNRKASLEENGVDWIPTFFGEEITEWAWWNNDWSSKQKITLNTSTLGLTGDITKDTVIFVDINSAQTDFWNIVKNDGSDVRFVSGDETTEYDFHFEGFDYAAQDLNAWVEVTQTFTSAADTEIYVYYGNSGAVDAQDEPGTYPAPYTAVYHMNDNNTGGQMNSLGDENFLVHLNTPTVNTDGMLGTAVQYVGADSEYSNASQELMFTQTKAFTISLWHMSDAGGGGGVNKILFTKKQNAADDSITVEWNAASQINIFVERNGGGFGQFQSINTTWTAGEWYHIVAIVDTVGNLLRLYVNGTWGEGGSVAIPGAGVFAEGVTSPLRINANNLGAENGTQHFDEIKVFYGTALTADDVNLMYASESKGLIEFEASETLPRVIDLNITTINGVSFKTPQIFAYGLDGNITIDFNVFQKENKRLTIDLNYSTHDTQGTGTNIVNDLNLTADICPDQDWDDEASECSISWDYSTASDNNYMINGTITDGALQDFNSSDGNFQLINDVNLTIYTPIDETTGEIINTSTYAYIVKVLNSRLITYPNNLDTNYFSIPLSESITVLIDTNVDAYYWGREYSLFYDTITTTDSIQPYLAPLGSSVLTTVHTVSMATLTAIPDMRIKVFKQLEGGRTLINDSITDGKGETAVAFVIADNYEIEVWNNGSLLFTEDYVATSTTNNHYIYLPLGGEVEFPVIPNISVRFLPAIRERTSTDFNIQVIIASNNDSITAARVNIFNNGINLYDTGIDALISSDGNTYIINVHDLPGLDAGYPIDANVTVWLIDGTTITAREDSWRVFFADAPEDSFIWLLTNGMRKDFGCSYGTDELLRPTCQPLFLISIFIIFFAIGGLALNQFRNGTMLAIMAIIMTSFFVYITWIPFVWGVLMAVGGIVIIITTSRVDM